MADFEDCLSFLDFIRKGWAGAGNEATRRGIDYPYQKHNYLVIK